MPALPPVSTVRLARVATGAASTAAGAGHYDTGGATMDVEIMLTPEQIEQLCPLAELAKRAYDSNAPGMIIGQAMTGNIRQSSVVLRFLTHDEAKIMSAAGNKVVEMRKVASDAEQEAQHGD